MELLSKYVYFLVSFIRGGTVCVCVLVYMQLCALHVYACVEDKLAIVTIILTWC